MNTINLDILKFAAEECKRQRVTDPLKVWHYVEAWHDALHQNAVVNPSGLSLREIQRWAARIERDRNVEGRWRGYFASVHRSLAPAPQEVGELMRKWLRFVPDMTPEEAYKEFEEIHPFADGNGRVGKIIYNWLRGTLEYPVLPPNFWEGDAP